MVAPVQPATPTPKQPVARGPEVQFWGSGGLGHYSNWHPVFPNSHV